MQSDKYKFLLREFLSVVIASKLTGDEIGLLSKELRYGSISEDLAAMLDSVVPHLTLSEKKSYENDDFLQVFNIIKEKKISKGALANILNSMGISLSDEFLRTRTSQKLIAEIFDLSSKKQQQNLLSILKASDQNDAYLKGISSKNRDI